VHVLAEQDRVELQREERVSDEQLVSKGGPYFDESDFSLGLAHGPVVKPASDGVPDTCERVENTKDNVIGLDPKKLEDQSRRGWDTLQDLWQLQPV